MSLILEALKKSEAERRLGRAPDLLTPAPTYGRRRRGPGVPTAIAVVALLIAAAAGAWLVLREDAAVVTAPDTPPDTAARVAGPVDAPPPVDAPREAARATAPSPTPVDSAPAGTPATPDDPEFASVERESLPVAASDDLPPMPPGDTPAREASQSNESHAAAPAPAEPVTRAPPAAPAAAPPHEPALPTLRELAPAERQALPPLEVTMHVFSDAPAGRFALIDGRRIAEGDTLADGLSVVEIRRDGVVLDLNGRRFLLPRPG